MQQYVADDLFISFCYVISINLKKNGNHLKALFIAILILFQNFAFSSENISFSASEVFYNLKTGKNEQINFNNNRHKVFVFLSKDCPCSKANLSLLNEYVSAFPLVDFIGIHAMKNKTPEDLKNFEIQNINFPVYNDTELIITRKFHALKTPHAFITSPNGEIIYMGGVTNSMMPKNAKTFYLKDALSELAQNKPITTKESKTLGCYIVR